MRKRIQIFRVVVEYNLRGIKKLLVGADSSLARKELTAVISKSEERTETRRMDVPSTCPFLSESGPPPSHRYDDMAIWFLALYERFQICGCMTRVSS